jgi:hypothetical protein
MACVGERRPLVIYPRRGGRVGGIVAVAGLAASRFQVEFVAQDGVVRREPLGAALGRTV